MDRRHFSVGLSALAAFGLIALGACTIDVRNSEPGDSAVLRARLAKQLCEVAPLADERDNYMRSLDGVAHSEGIDLSAGAGVHTPSGSVDVGAHAAAGLSQTTSGDASYEEEHHTILRDKLLHYRAEIEANYRFVTMNCTAYNLCLQQSAGRMPDCQSQQQALLSSQDKFNQIAFDLASLRDSRHGDWRGHHRDCDGDDCGSRPDCHAAHCNVEGGVFLTGCCYREH